jgi:hypothetical protein
MRYVPHPELDTWARAHGVDAVDVGYHAGMRAVVKIRGALRAKLDRRLDNAIKRNPTLAALYWRARERSF